jgi:hypothetical protein
MATLQEIIDNNQTLTRAKLKADKGLVTEVQIKLRNLGLYPGGPWIDGDLGNGDTFTWRGLQEFCKASNLVGLPSDTIAIDAKIATELIARKQFSFILEQAKDTNFIRQKLEDIQENSPVAVNIGVNDAFVARSLRNSPFAAEIDNYPEHLEQKPNGTDLVSYGTTFTLPGSGKTVTFSNYPDRGNKPTIDATGLSFLPGNISHACLCIGSFGDDNSTIKARWFGKNALEPQQLLSATKFIGALGTIDRLNTKSAATDVDTCVIESPRLKFLDLLIDMISYRKDADGNIGRSNQVGALFKRFHSRPELEKWLHSQTGNKKCEFKGAFGIPSLITDPVIKDLTSNQVVLNAASTGETGNNMVAVYDLVRLLSMLGWHLHLAPSARFDGSQWKSLECLVRAMGTDPARYIDVALETLGVINLISKPVVISKVGFGPSSFTYVALAKFVDNRVQPAKLRTFALALRSPGGSNEVRDTNLAAAVTEVVRRILTEELA